MGWGAGSTQHVQTKGQERQRRLRILPTQLNLWWLYECGAVQQFRAIKDVELNKITYREIVDEKKKISKKNFFFLEIAISKISQVPSMFQAPF